MSPLFLKNYSDSHVVEGIRAIQDGNPDNSRDDNPDLMKEIKIPLERCDEVDQKKKRVGAKAQSTPTPDLLDEDDLPVSRRIQLKRKSGSRDSSSVTKRGKATPGQMVKTRTAAQRKIYTDSSEDGVETAVTVPGKESRLKSKMERQSVISTKSGPSPKSPATGRLLSRFVLSSS